MTFSQGRPRTQLKSSPSVAVEGPCPSLTGDLTGILRALRPLGDLGSITRHAADCGTCFSRLTEFFITTSPDQNDPIHRLIDGLNVALYRLAKSLLCSTPQAGTDDFNFDLSPVPVKDAAEEAIDRLEALDEYMEGRYTRTGEAAPLRELIQRSLTDTDHAAEIAQALLKRSISIGGRYGLDAANLLGFIRYRRGDLDGAEILFRTVIERPAADLYERETQAHAMNNLTGVCLGRDDLKTAILWCERSLMLKERLHLDARSNHLNLLIFWLENGTSYGAERSRHYMRSLLVLDGGKVYMEKALSSPAYAEAVASIRRAGLDKEFPEVELPPDKRQKTLGLKEKEQRAS